jgi:uncharacterized delta-60 repeat protein
MDGKRSHAMTDFAKLRLSAVVSQADGKLLVAGTADRHGGTQTDFDMLVCRFHSSGELDLAFGSPKTPGCATVNVNWVPKGMDSASSMRVEPDGDIVIAGQIVFEDERTTGAIARLTPEGELDKQFGEGGVTVFDEIMVTPGSSMAISDLTIAPDGHIIAAGHIRFTANDSDFAVVRVDSNGVPDESFGTEKAAKVISFDLANVFSSHDRARNVALLPNGSVIVSGEVQIGTDSFQMGVAKLTPAGQLDETFGEGGIAMHLFCDVCINAMARGLIVSDSDIVVAGTISGDPQFLRPDFGLMRLTLDGDVDTSFGQQGRTFVEFDLVDGNSADTLTAMVQHNDGLLVAGHVDAGADPVNQDFAIARLEH